MTLFVYQAAVLRLYKDQLSDLAANLMLSRLEVTVSELQ
jgi:hypothetical protein